jgi:hypothetical protein
LASCPATIMPCLSEMVLPRPKASQTNSIAMMPRTAIMYRSPEVDQQGVQDLAQILDIQRVGGHDRTSPES